MYDDDQEDNEISSQPLMPYVGMEFDSVDDAKHCTMNMHSRWALARA